VKVNETRLVADSAEAGAMLTDPRLLNAWGLAFNPGGPAWISDNHSGIATVYETAKIDAGALLTVTVPNVGDAGGPSSPTGQIFNSGTSFMGDKFIVATENGSVAGWQPTDAGFPSTYTTRVDGAASGAVYTGLTIVPATTPILLAADFHNAKIDAFDTNYARIAGDGGAIWHDPNIPTGYAPYNVAAIGTSVYVAYAKQQPGSNDAQGGIGFGAISVFDVSGALTKSLIVVGAELNAPWGMAAVPAAGWGSLPTGTLIVGNFGDGAIHAFNPTTGALVATLASGVAPLIIDGLWGLAFGPDAADAGTTPQQLYFASGPHSQANGLFGYLTIAP
jgi:uncharacterized protein (TIGR03118 family)